LNARNIDNKEFIDPTPLFCNSTDKYQAGPNITCVMREVRNSFRYNFLYNKKMAI